MNTEFQGFDDLECGEFDAEPVNGAAAANRPTFPCSKCNGKGLYTYGYHHVRTGKCHACNGKGHFMTSAADRFKSRQAVAKRKTSKAESNWESFAAANVEAAAWLTAANGNFASSLTESVRKYGSLTEGQLAAVHRIIASDAERKTEAAVVSAVLDLKPVFEKFETAKAAGLKRPKLRLDGFCFMLASGRNAGSIYVKAGPAYEDTYLGKVSASGEFNKSRDCTPEQVEALKAIAGNVLEAAVAYGRKTGDCACCGRELTNAESISLGIGPICLSKWGF